MRKICYIEFPSNGINYHRLLVPLQNLVANHNYKVLAFKTTYDALRGFKFEKGDIFIFARQFPVDVNHPEEAVRFADYLHSKGVKIVMDIDDYWHLYKGHLIGDKWTEQKKQFVELSLKIADIVTTTNDALKSKIRRFNKRVYVLPNAINQEDGQWLPKPKNWRGVRFGYFGGNTHQQDLQVMQTNMAEFDSYCAMDEHQEFGFKHNLGVKAVNEYATHYDSINVALAPLVENKFNNRKSNLKIIEAGFKKCCVVASDVRTFNFDKEYRDAVIFVKNGTSWRETLKYLESNKKEVEERAEALHEVVKKGYDINFVNLQRNKIFKAL